MGLHGLCYYYFYYYLVCETIGTAAIPGLLCQPRVKVKMIVEKQMECRLAGETEVLSMACNRDIFTFTLRDQQFYYTKSFNV
jgi:hypothetical protein